MPLRSAKADGLCSIWGHVTKGGLSTGISNHRQALDHDRKVDLQHCAMEVCQEVISRQSGPCVHFVEKAGVHGFSEVAWLSMQSAWEASFW
jgi:hypothetical protein